MKGHLHSTKPTTGVYILLLSPIIDSLFWPCGCVHADATVSILYAKTWPERLQTDYHRLCHDILGDNNSQDTLGDNNSQDIFGDNWQDTLGDNNSQDTLGDNNSQDTLGGNNSQVTSIYNQNPQKFKHWKKINYWQWSQTVVSDSGLRQWSQTVVSDSGLTDSGLRQWSQTVVSDSGLRLLLCDFCANNVFL